MEHNETYYLSDKVLKLYIKLHSMPNWWSIPHELYHSYKDLTDMIVARKPQIIIDERVQLIEDMWDMV